MKNPFKGYEFKEETDRKMILEYFGLLYGQKCDSFPRLKLLQVSRAFKARLPDFDMSLEDLKNHLDALAEAPNNDLVAKKDEYYMRE